jgi:hypothetical protein
MIQLLGFSLLVLTVVAYAEAGNQGPEGLTAVVYTVLNRVASGSFQNDIQTVIDARDQFEPVTKAGGWRNLPPLSPDVQAQFDLLLLVEVPDRESGTLARHVMPVLAARVLEAEGRAGALALVEGGEKSARCGLHPLSGSRRRGLRSGLRRPDEDGRSEHDPK